jgi:hypothetical protein
VNDVLVYPYNTFDFNLQVQEHLKLLVPRHQILTRDPPHTHTHTHTPTHTHPPTLALYFIRAKFLKIRNKGYITQ